MRTTRFPIHRVPILRSEPNDTQALRRAQGSALVIVLWSMAILGAVTISTLHSTRLGVRMARNQGDSVQAYYLALAGIEEAKAHIYQTIKDGETNATAFTDTLFDDAEKFRDVKIGRGLYRIIRSAQQDEPAAGWIYGILDEERFLNVNAAGAGELQKILEIDEMIAASIVDWRDDDSKRSTNGAEAPHYLELSPPYRIRNAPFETLREILMVQGVKPDEFLREDANGNGLLDPEEDDGEVSAPADNANGVLESGWIRHLTVESAARNITARGRDPVNVKNAGAEELTGVDGITQDIAQAIVAHRGNGSLNSIADLLDVRRVQNQGNPNAGNPGAGNPNPGNDPGNSNPGIPGLGNVQSLGSTIDTNGSTFTTSSSVVQPPTNAPPQPNTQQPGTGEKLISRELLMQIADEITASDGTTIPGVINLNSADAIVLACLPGMTEELAEAAVAYRGGNGFFRNTAELLNVTGMTDAIFKQACPRVCVRSDTYRITCEGEIPQTGARRRVQVVVRYDGVDFDTLAYREEP